MNDEEKRSEARLQNLQAIIEIEDGIRQVHQLKVIDIGKYS